jgi:hypothetical protein
MWVAARRKLRSGRCDKIKQDVFLRAFRNCNLARSSGYERPGNRL